jgi:hypothetical protein
VDVNDKKQKEIRSLRDQLLQNTAVSFQPEAATQRLWKVQPAVSSSGSRWTPPRHFTMVSNTALFSALPVAERDYKFEVFDRL